MGDRNLAYLKETEIIEFAPMSKSYGKVEKGEKNILTDGHIGDVSSCYGGTWVHFYRGIGRRIVVDLGDEYAVSGFETAFLHDRGMGIYSPEEVRFLLSDNGKDYYPVASCLSPNAASDRNILRAEYTAKTDFPFKARYAAFEFNVEVNSFCDGIKVFGGDIEGGESELCGKPAEIINIGSYAPRASYGGNDICLLYYGYYPANDRVARMDKTAILPYVAYLDSEKNIVDKMFDGVMFLIVQGACPSGGCLGYFGKGNLYSDWQYIEDILFERDYNLDALDQAVADMKKALSLPDDYKYDVYIQAPTAKISREVFGDYNGDGIEEKLLTVEDCIDAYTHYAKDVQRRFDSYGFENIRLTGWFWGNESLSRSENDFEEQYAAGCVEALHRLGHKVIFIPYYQAGGCQMAEKVGFDHTTMQPGLTFNAVLQSDPVGTMEDFAELCKQYGFGIEIEIHQGVRALEPENREKYIKLFKQYLRSCVSNGMMRDTLHTYYQCAGPGVYHDCCLSKDPEIRNLYDLVYKFIKGTLTLEDIDGASAEEAISVEDIIAPEASDGNDFAEEAEDIPENIPEETEETPDDSFCATPEEEPDPGFTLDIGCEADTDFVADTEEDADTLAAEAVLKAENRRKLIYTSAIAAIAAGIAFAVYKKLKRKHK